jgi:uncharacterized membrane protein YkvA (DUF1232 family)
MRVTFDLSENDLRYFRRVMKDVRDRVKNKPEEAIVEAARDLLHSVRDMETPDFVRQRIERLSTLIDMLEDNEWALKGTDRERVLRGMAYFADPDDIIPDKVPVLGLLDDAIMIELVVTELGHEIEADSDFCEFRLRREKVVGRNEDPASRNEWLVSRRQQLHQRMRRRRSRRVKGRAGGGPKSPLALW